ncbi:hypothetical protein EGR_00219 [Echinococcus granulosus]|uniref:Uncharacterized protein n=1 Tax=Echinococcus granulosus TaxID=6210 RepID=W6UTK3_ECHGR|nr:hypothetical protein EGR_00219 [Echinococcus granulosus]EUB64950.1 hypothetical protein EGR_00219 [Echinococcus granulosus]
MLEQFKCLNSTSTKKIIFYSSIFLFSSSIIDEFYVPKELLQTTLCVGDQLIAGQEHQAKWSNGSKFDRTLQFSYVFRVEKSYVKVVGTAYYCCRDVHILGDFNVHSYGVNLEWNTIVRCNPMDRFIIQCQRDFKQPLDWEDVFSGFKFENLRSSKHQKLMEF